MLAQKNNQAEGKIAAKLRELGLELPEAATPAANYVPYVISGNQLFISGQITAWNGEVKFIGKVGKDFDITKGQEAAKICVLNVLAHAQAACGSLDKIVRCIRLGVFVNSTPEFTDQPQVANGASDLMVQLLGEKGKHARFAVGVSGLPRGVAVEVDATFEI